jgi:hypothetical protein
VSEDFLKIGPRYIEEFKKQVFQVHLVVGLGKTKAGCGFQCAPAGVVQFSDQ